MRIPEHMAAVQLIGHGGVEKLCYADAVPVPRPGPGEALIRVKAAGVNNTDINTRIGWYAATSSTGAAETGDVGPANGDWAGAGLIFPRIQGADVCGDIVAVGAGVPGDRLGQRVIVQSCLLSLRQGNFTPWLGSERDGAFAQFVCVPSADTYSVDCALTDEELASVPCAFATAENLLTRAGIAAGETVLITGASGNVGVASIQLAHRRRARVIAVAAPGKHNVLQALGAERCVSRDTPLADTLGKDSVDVVIDVVGGPQWPDLLDVLRTLGRYAVSGAIAGPIVRMDLRKLYLKDLTFHGCTAQDPQVFPALVSYLERGEIKPLVASRYPLREIAAAQAEFLSKTQIGKIVLIPPSVD